MCRRGILPACVSIHHMCAWCQRNWKRASDHPGNGVQTVWDALKVLEIELGFSGSATSASNCWAISLASTLNILNECPWLGSQGYLAISTCLNTWHILGTLANSSVFSWPEVQLNPLVARISEAGEGYRLGGISCLHSRQFWIRTGEKCSPVTPLGGKNG